MRQYGLKLWSKDFIRNKPFVDTATAALKNGKFDYLELFALPDSYDSCYKSVAEAVKGVKTIIHAPHSGQRLDTGNPDEFENNRKRIEDSFRFADLLGADMIIIHPGMNGGERYLNETIRQFRLFNDKRLIVENLPAICSTTHLLLHGVSPQEIKQIMQETGMRFCLDFSHAICGANSHKKDIYKVLDEFKALKPSMYHLCDGDCTSDDDSHMHFGEGNYNLKRLLCNYTEENAFITMETGAGIPVNVDAWLKDISYIRQLERN